MTPRASSVGHSSTASLASFTPLLSAFALPALLTVGACSKGGGAASTQTSSTSASTDAAEAPSPLGHVPEEADGAPLPEATGPSFEGVMVMHITELGRPPQDVMMVTKGNKIRVDVPREKGHDAHSIFDPATGQALIILDDQKVAMTTVVPPASETQMGLPPVVTKSTKHETIAGRDCEDWDVVEAIGDKHQQLCVAEGMLFFDFTALAPPGSTGATMGSWLAQLREAKEFPLRTITFDPSGKEKSRMEVTKIEAKPIDDAVFRAPVGYRQVDMSKMGHMFNPLIPHKPR